MTFFCKCHVLIFLGWPDRIVAGVIEYGPHKENFLMFALSEIIMTINMNVIMFFFWEKGRMENICVTFFGGIFLIDKKFMFSTLCH